MNTHRIPTPRPATIGTLPRLYLASILAALAISAPGAFKAAAGSAVAFDQVRGIEASKVGKQRLTSLIDDASKRLRKKGGRPTFVAATPVKGYGVVFKNGDRFGYAMGCGSIGEAVAIAFWNAGGGYLYDSWIDN